MMALNSWIHLFMIGNEDVPIYLQRQEFEDEKARFLQNQFLRITPFNNKRQGEFCSPTFFYSTIC